MEKDSKDGEKKKILIIHERINFDSNKFLCLCQLRRVFSHEGYSKYSSHKDHSKSSRKKRKIEQNDDMNNGGSEGVSDLTTVRKDHVKKFKKNGKSESSKKSKVEKLLRIRPLKKQRQKDQNQKKTSKKSWEQHIKIEPVDQPDENPSLKTKIPGEPTHSSISGSSDTSSTETNIYKVTSTDNVLKKKFPIVVLQDFMIEPEHNCDPIVYKYREKILKKTLMQTKTDAEDKEEKIVPCQGDNGDDNPEQSVGTTSYIVQEMPESPDIDMFRNSSESLKSKLKTKEKLKQGDCKESDSETVFAVVKIEKTETTKSHNSSFRQNDDENIKIDNQGLADLQQEIKEIETELGDKEKELNESLEETEISEEKYQHFDVPPICQKFAETKTMTEKMPELTSVRKVNADLKIIKNNLKNKISNGDELRQKVELMDVDVSLQNIKEKFSQSIEKTLSEKQTSLVKQDFANHELKQDSDCNLIEKDFKKPVAPSHKFTSPKKQAPLDLFDEEKEMLDRMHRMLDKSLWSSPRTNDGKSEGASSSSFTREIKVSPLQDFKKPVAPSHKFTSPKKQAPLDEEKEILDRLHKMLAKRPWSSPRTNDDKSEGASSLSFTREIEGSPLQADCF